MKKKKLTNFKDAVIFGTMIFLANVLSPLINPNVSLAVYTQLGFWVLTAITTGGAVILKYIISYNTLKDLSLADKKYVNNEEAILKAKSAITRASLSKKLGEFINLENLKKRVMMRIDELDYQCEPVMRAQKKNKGLPEVETLLVEKEEFVKLYNKLEKALVLTDEDLDYISSNNNSLKKQEIDEIDIATLYAGTQTNSSRSSIGFNEREAVSRANRKSNLTTFAFIFVVNSLGVTLRSGITWAVLIDMVFRIVPLPLAIYNGGKSGRAAFEDKLTASENRLQILTRFIDENRAAIDAALNGKPKPSEEEIKTP